MTTTSTNEAIAHAIDQLAAEGLIVESLELDKRTYCPVSREVVGKPPKKDTGRYYAKLITLRDGGSMVIGWWKNYWADTWGKFEPPDSKLDRSQLEEIAKHRKAMDAQRAKDAKEAAESCAERARKLWSRAREHGRTPYLDRKGIDRVGARVMRDSLVVPIYSIERKLVGLQFIQADGEKRFLTGTPKQGAFSIVGELDVDGDDVVIGLAEGYATAVSIYMATGWPVLVCFDAGNLQPVATAWREQHDDHRMVVCCDDDHGQRKNPGKSKGIDAAKAVRGAWCWPIFRHRADRTDFNDLHAEQGLDAVREIVVGAAKRARGGKWRQQLTYSKRSGGYKANQHNVALILERDPAWAGLLRLDSFANRIVMTREPPFGGTRREVTDAELSEIAAWFGHPYSYDMSVSQSLAAETVSMVATRYAYHPVCEYLDALEWDGVPRVDGLFTAFFGGADDDYTLAVSRLFMLSCVARVRHPGCKVDTMVVLEGSQGLGKSSGIRELVGPEWFMDTSQPFGDKDFYQALAGKWVIELAEIAALSKPDVNKVKAGLSAQKDTYRPSYGRVARDYPRQCVFVGTTNESEYLRDHTGARRFLPVRAGFVDRSGLRQNRDQLWAEASVRYREACERGESWWQVPESAQEEQDARYQDDPWAVPVAQWLAGKGGEEQYPAENKSITLRYVTGPGRQVHRASVSDLLRWAVHVDFGRHTQQESGRMGRIMTRLGWTQRRLGKQEAPSRPRVYERPAEAPACVSAPAPEVDDVF